MGGAVSLSGVAGPPPASHPSQAFRANTGMLSNLNIQQHAQGGIPSPSMYRAKASAATSSAGKAKHPQRAGNSQQPVSQTTILNQKQIKMANSNTRASKQASANMVVAANGQAMPRDQPQLRQMNPNANQATIVQLQVQLNSFPVSAKNQQRTRSSKQKISTAQQQNYSAEYHHQAQACALALDSSKIEYLDEVDVSSNTIQNINQQLCQGLNQPHQATTAHANMLAALHDSSQMGPYINHNTSYQLQEDSRGPAIGKGGAQKRKARSKKRAAPVTGAY